MGLWVRLPLHTTFSKTFRRFRACPAARDRLRFLIHRGSCPCSWEVQPLRGDHRGSCPCSWGVQPLKGIFQLYTQTFHGHAFSRNLLSHPQCWQPCISPPRIFMCCLMPKNIFLFLFLEESPDLEKFHPYSITAEKYSIRILKMTSSSMVLKKQISHL